MNEFILVSLMSDSSVIPSVQVPRPSMRRTPRSSKFSGTESRPVASVSDFRVSATQLRTQARICSKRPNEMRKRRLKMIASSDEGSRRRSISRSIILPQVLSEYFGRPVRFDLPGRESVLWSTFFSSAAAARARTRASFALAANMQNVRTSSSLDLQERKLRSTSRRLQCFECTPVHRRNRTLPPCTICAKHTEEKRHSSSLSVFHTRKSSARNEATFRMISGLQEMVS